MLLEELCVSKSGNFSGLHKECPPDQDTKEYAFRCHASKFLPPLFDIPDLNLIAALVRVGTTSMTNGKTFISPCKGVMSARKPL